MLHAVARWRGAQRQVQRARRLRDGTAHRLGQSRQLRNANTRCEMMHNKCNMLHSKKCNMLHCRKCWMWSSGAARQRGAALERARQHCAYAARRRRSKVCCRLVSSQCNQGWHRQQHHTNRSACVRARRSGGQQWWHGDAQHERDRDRRSGGGSFWMRRLACWTASVHRWSRRTAAGAEMEWRSRNRRLPCRRRCYARWRKTPETAMRITQRRCGGGRQCCTHVTMP